MAVAYVATGTHAESNGDATSLNVGYAGTPSAGNLMVLFMIDQRDGNPAWQTPSGWSAGPNTTALSVFWKIAVGGESGSVTVTKNGSSGECGGVMLLFSGADATTPILVSNVSASSLTVSTMTPSVANTLWCWFAGSTDFSGSVGSAFSNYAMATNNPTWTERDDNGRAGQIAMGVATSTIRTQTTATGNCTASGSGAGQPRAIVFALQEQGTQIKTVDGLAKASVKTVDDLAIASVKTIDGLA